VKYLFLLVCCLYSLPIFAEVSVNLNLSSTSVALEDQVDVSVQVAGDRQAEQPVFPASPDYDIQFVGTSSQVQIINGAITSSTEFSFVLQPKKIGTFSVGPCSVEVSGKTYRSSAVQLQVTKGDESKPNNEKYFFVTASVDNLNPYMYSQLVYSFKFYNRARITGANFKAPEFSGFTREELGKQREYQENYGGQLWQVTEIKLALFPSSSGTITIDPATLTVNALVEEPGRRRHRSGGIAGFFDDAFSSQRQKTITLHTEALKLGVQPLPAPANGEAKTLLVGNFSLTSTLSAHQAKVGDSLTMTVVVEGEGNIWDASVEQPNLADFKVYADKPSVKSEVRNSHIYGRKEFKFALVPQSQGAKDLPQFVVRYFDPARKSYQKLFTPEEKLAIAPADEQEVAPQVLSNKPALASQREVAVLGSDLMPLKTASAELHDESPKSGELWLLVLSFLLCPSLYGALYFMRQCRLTGADGEILLRRKKAYREFKRDFARLASSANYHRDALQGLRNYLSNKFALAGSALTAADVSRLLGGQQRLQSADLEALAGVLQACEQGLYGGARGAGEDNHKLARQIEEIVGRIEQQVR
jgi:hypothetical protein